MAVARFIHVVVFLLLSLEELGLQVSQVQGRPLPLLRPVSGSLKPSAKQQRDLSNYLDYLYGNGGSYYYYEDDPPAEDLPAEEPDSPAEGSDYQEGSALGPPDPPTSVTATPTKSLWEILQAITSPPETAGANPIAFTCQLGGTNLTIEPGASLRLKNFAWTKLGHIVTTNWLQLDEGLLTVDKQTVCFLSVTVELATPPFDCVSTSDHLTVSLCIDGDCETNGALRSTSGIASEKFSVTTTGILYLEPGQSIGVYITNEGDKQLTLKSSLSHFSGQLSTFQ